VGGDQNYRGQGEQQLCLVCLNQTALSLLFRLYLNFYLFLPQHSPPPCPSHVNSGWW
jgi:hypothetical protein